MPSLTRVLILFFLLAFSFSASIAQTSTTVVTGGVARQLSLSSLSFNLTGQGFASSTYVAGSLRTLRTASGGDAEVFTPGSTMYVHCTYDDFFGTNMATFNGVTHYPVYYGGYWVIDSGPVVMPSVEADVITLTVPFTLTGVLDGYSKPYQSAIRPDDLIFSTNLEAHGIATMQMVGRRGFNGNWEYDLVTNTVIFNFQPSANLPETIKLSSTSYTVNEGSSSGVATVTVQRVGDVSSASAVDYLTQDTVANSACEKANNYAVASERCDYATSVGTLRFAPGETSKTIQIPIIDDAYVESKEGFSISLLNARGDNLGPNASAIITILDNDTQAPTQNPIYNQAFFIRQQYIDFLGRVPEPAGFDFWMNRMNNCPAGQTCDRIDTSLRFFQSDEFQTRGFFVYRLFDAVLGLLPRYQDFVSDTARLNGYQTTAEQRQAKDEYLLNFINSSYFKILYSKYLEPDGMKAKDAAGFVNALCQQAGITPASKQTLIDNLQTGVRDPAHTVEDFINTPEISGVGTKVYDRGFITMQYFGYLRRDPEQAGFNFWVGQLIGANAPHRGDYRFMVGGFLQSDEYIYRFAETPSH
jgi:hypothetical protein